MRAASDQTTTGSATMLHGCCSKPQATVQREKENGRRSFAQLKKTVPAKRRDVLTFSVPLFVWPEPAARLYRVDLIRPVGAMPSAFAVLRLIVSTYLVGACTGRSPGSSPLRMRS